VNQDQQRVIEVLDVLYGDGAYEITKAMTKQQKNQQTQARVGLASNVVGLGAGIAGTAAALRDDRFKEGGKAAKWLHEKSGKLPSPISSKKGRAGAMLAGGALGLQVANIAGDAVANRVLARSAKKPETHKKLVKKNAPDAKQIKYKLVKKGVNAVGTGAKQAPKVAATTMARAQMAPDLSQKAVEVVRKDDVDFTVRGEVSKMNVDLKQVFGWASVIEMNGEPVIDLQDDVMTIETIEKAAYDYVHKSRKGGRQHQRNGEEPLHVSDMIESFVLTPEKKEQMGLPTTTPTGWWVGFQINDDDTWQSYKDGKLKEFSIHGSGVRKDMEV
jgi:hypothetical protein